MFVMVAKCSDITHNGWNVPTDRISICHWTWKYYLKKLSDNFTSNMLRTGYYPFGLMPSGIS